MQPAPPDRLGAREDRSPSWKSCARRSTYYKPCALPILTAGARTSSRRSCRRSRRSSALPAERSSPTPPRTSTSRTSSPRRAWWSRSTKAGYVKRLPVATYRQQKRGGKGMQGGEPEGQRLRRASVRRVHPLLHAVFSTTGKVYRLKVYELPEASRHARGTAIVERLLPLAKGRPSPRSSRRRTSQQTSYLMFATESRHGEEDIHGASTTARAVTALSPSTSRTATRLISVQPRGSRRERHYGVICRQGHHVGLRTRFAPWAAAPWACAA